MMDFKEEWNLPMALSVLGSAEVDSATWAAAVKWLLFYGPPEIRELLSQAATIATSAQFPELIPAGYDEQGRPCYGITELAKALGMSEEKLLGQMAAREDATDQPQFVDPAKARNIH